MMLRPGARLGAYEPVSAIGAGDMGEVYRAPDTRLNRDVAIKTPPDDFTLDAQHLARFERECSSCRSSRGVARVSADGQRFLASTRDASAPPPAPSPINVVVNWREQMKRAR